MGVILAGDANNNDIVNVIDFHILKMTFGKSSGDTGFDRRADFNDNGAVNILDFNLIKGNFGQEGAPPATPRNARK